MQDYKVCVTAEEGSWIVWHHARAANPDDALTVLERAGKYNPKTERITKFIIPDRLKQTG